MMRFGKKGNWNIPFCKKPNRFAPAYITKIVNQVNNVASIIKPQWKFLNQSFEKTILDAQKDDMIYCDPPYYGRSVDYFNSWSESDEKKLFDLLNETKAKFILSTWHHSEWRSNEMIGKYWGKFNIVTKDHFYHNGGHLENRKSVVEALVCKKSGFLATSTCRSYGTAYTEYFVSGTEPIQTCPYHSSAKVCTESGLLANENCPRTKRVSGRGEYINDNGLWKNKSGYYKPKNVPLNRCTMH